MTTDLPPPETVGVFTNDATFTIQVSSFAASNERVAEAYEEEIEKTTGYDLALVPADDGTFIRACVGGFTDRESALAVQQALSKSPYFTDCFVKPVHGE